MGMLLTLLAIGLIGLVVLSVVLALVGTIISIAFGIATFLLLKVAPVLLVGWVVLKLVGRARSQKLSAADERWLDGK